MSLIVWNFAITHNPPEPSVKSAIPQGIMYNLHELLTLLCPAASYSKSSRFSQSLHLSEPQPIPMKISKSGAETSSLVAVGWIAKWLGWYHRICTDYKRGQMWSSTLGLSFKLNLTLCNIIWKSLAHSTPRNTEEVNKIKVLKGSKYYRDAKGLEQI